jgi:hypothetical protein
METYVNNNTLVQNDLALMFKSSINCILCNNILIEPLMCMNCQKVCCKKCIDKWKIDNNEKCPNNCSNPNYQNCRDRNEILSKLKFICVGCNNEIEYNEAKNHHDSCCPGKTSENMNLNKTPNVERLKKLNSDEMNHLQKEGNEVTYITGKKKNIIFSQ